MNEEQAMNEAVRKMGDDSHQSQLFSEAQVSIYYNLFKIWIANPTQRFNQLVSNLQHEYSNRNDSALIRDDTKTIDAFYLTDEKFASFLQDFVDEHSV